MDIEQLRDYCLTKPFTEEGFPFGPETLVFKVNGKLYLLTSLDTPQLQFNVKCDPSLAEELREQFPCVIPGFHMNKKHWNTVIIDRTLTNKQLRELIDHSYELVTPKKKKK